MDGMQRWSGREARALREALRLSVRAFAARLGVSERTISKWEEGGGHRTPGPDSQAILDTTYANAGDEARARFWDALGGAPTPPRASGPGFAIVPPLEPILIRRSDDYDALISIITEAAATVGTPVITVAGPGGFGKTTLATQACHDQRVRDLFPDILWVETGEDCTPARVVELISDLCYHLDAARPALTDPEQAGFHLARVIEDRRLLLAIDNVWSGADLSPFLHGAPRCLRLVTTRNIRVSPSTARVLRLGPMSSDEIAELLHRTLPPSATGGAAPLADLCGGWPLLATVVGANVSHDVNAGASPQRAIAIAGDALRIYGPHAFDVWDTDQRRNAIGHVISASLAALDEHVTISGGPGLRERYLSLAVFPAATPIPISALTRWWRQAHGWTEVAVRQFCRILADRSLINAYLADRDAIVIHDVFRAFLRHLTDDQWSELHRSLLDAQRPATGDWLELSPDHTYLWRHLSYHLDEANSQDELAGLLATPDYVISKAFLCGHPSLATDQQLADNGANQSTNHELADQWQTAQALTGSGYLLHGLTTKQDMANTLLAAMERQGHAPAAMDQLRRTAASTGSGLTLRWARATSSDRHVGHVGAVVNVATHDQLLVSGGEDGVVRLWDLPSRRLLHQWRGHTGWVYATAISADGSLVASAGEDAAIRLWNANTGGAVGILAGHGKRIRALAFSSAGRTLVSGGEDGHIHVWDTDRQTHQQQLATVGTPIWSISIGCDDTVVAAAGEDEFVRIYNLHTGQLLDEKALHHDWVRSVAFAPTTPTLASGSGDGTVRVWQVDNNRLRPIQRIDVGENRVRAVAVTDHAEMVIAAGEEATLQAFTVDGPAGQVTMPPGVDWVRTIALTREGVAAGCEDGGLRLWQPSRDSQPATLAEGANTIWSATFADNGQVIATGHGNGTIQLCDPHTMVVRRRISAEPGRVWSLAASGDYVAAACGDGGVRVWSLTDATFATHLNVGERRSWAVAVAPSGELLAASDSTGHVRVWQLPSGKLLWEQDAKAGRVRSLAFNGNANLLAAAGGDGVVRLWQASTGQPLSDDLDVSGWARTVALDGAGARLAVGTGTGDIHVHHLGSGLPIRHLVGHNGRVLMLGFTSHTDQLVSAAADGTARQWSLSRQEQIAQVRVDAAGQCAAFDAIHGGVLVGSAAGLAALTIHNPPGAS